MGDSDINGKLQNALAALIKLTAENERLRTENRALRVKVIANEKEPTSSLDLLEPPTIVKALVDSKNSVITALSSKSDKIALFQSLFRGREDVYPTR